MKIYIIRHGETDWNVKGLLQGQTDTELNEYGIELARVTGRNMKGIKFDKCISSPLKRAYETARIVLCESGNDIPIETDKRIMEIFLGEREGLPGTTKVGGRSLFNRPDVDKKNPGGESMRDVMVRSQEFLK